MQRTRHANHRRSVQKRGNSFHVKSGRHHHDAEIIASAPRLARQCQAEVGMNAPLVKLVDDDRREVGQQRILLEARRQDTLGDDEQPRIARESSLESDLPSDFASDRPPAFLRNPPRHRAGGKPLRLQKNDRTGVDERGCDACGLAGAW
jgi:hypothetical protein